MTGFRSLARNHDFTVLWIGSTISALGSSMSTFTFPLVAYALTGSAVTTSLAETAYLTGMLAMLIPAGVLADRRNRRMLMRASAAGGVALYASVVGAAIAGVLTLPHLLLVALLTGAAGGLFSPAESSAVRTIVSTEELPTALSQQQARQHVASLLGAPVGGLLYAVARWVPFLADAISYAANWILLGSLRADLDAAATDPQEPARSPLRDIGAGWRFLFGHPFFRVLGCWAPLANLSVNAVFFVAILRLIQGGYPAWQIGLVETAAGVAGILGALCAPWLIDRLPTGTLMIGSAWAFVPLLVPMAIWNGPVVVGAAVALGIFINPAGNAGISSYAQTQMPADMLGRFSSTMQFTSMSMLPLSPVIAGALLSVFGGAHAVIGLAAVCAVVALVPTLSRVIWAIPRPAEWAAEVAAPASSAASAAAV